MGLAAVFVPSHHEQLFGALLMRLQWNADLLTCSCLCSGALHMS